MARVQFCLMAMACVLASGPAWSAACGNTGAGFDKWKKAFAKEAQASGIGPAGIDALMQTSYSTRTIKADRSLHSFKLSLDEFMEKRGANAIISQGRKLKKSNAALFARLEKKYGVPPGPILAIWGMESGFGQFLGNQNTVSAVATLAYDCRRPEFFTEQLLAALQLVDQGTLSADSRGAMHGEVGQTQFMPKNVLLYGVSGDGGGDIDLTTKADALASTANFLKGHGWVRGLGYQPGEPNFVALQGWNAASVYQEALAIMGKAIDRE